MALALIITVYTLCGIYLIANFKYDLQMLQQNSYRPERYWRWLKPNLMPMWRLVDVLMLFVLFSTLFQPQLSMILVAMVAVAKTYIILRRKAKKPLVFTRRVWRLYTVTALLALAIYAVAIIFSGAWSEATGGITKPVVFALGTLFVMTTFSWAIVMAALWLLQPVEKAINRKFYNEARSILRSMPDLTVIGVTGSYGKTSTKHYLERILSEQYDVLMTPGSYNTTMGVIRTVREMMKPFHQVFICEMGAKQNGDIKEICDLVNPTIGVVTAVGPMHLETFKSIENVQATKFELVDALPADGLAVVNNDFEYCANRPVNNTQCIRYAVESTEPADYRATDIKYTPQGTEFTIVSADGKLSMPLRTRLVGAFNISNLIAAVIVALRMGVSEKNIRNAVAHIDQVEHRLNMKHNPGGITVIDDAFNSNPTGSRMAVDVLSQFTGGRRVIVTPGMIELGDEQYQLNRELGRHIATGADIAFIVAKVNRDALLEGLKDAGFPDDATHVVDSFAAAQQQLATLLRPGDTILYENDLPDSME